MTAAGVAEGAAWCPDGSRTERWTRNRTGATGENPAMSQRLQKLRQRLVEKELDAILVCQPENYRYISGFTGSAGALLVSHEEVVLATDSVHYEQAWLETDGVDIIRMRSKSEGMAGLLRGQERKRVGFEANSVSFAEHGRLSERVERTQTQLVPTEEVIESIRAVKEEKEVAYLARAAEIADRAMEYIAGETQVGMSEKEVAWTMEKFLRENGSENVAFDVIVASGPNAALPHARATDRAISAGEPIVFDLGARVNGYSSDLSRTLCLGQRPEMFVRVYEVVLQAQLAALDNLRPGMTGEEADSLARAVIEKAGYGTAFGHGLGHGVGLAVHEEPRLGPNSKDVLADRMVFTVEPGVYVVGWGGVRIEDTVMMLDGRVKMLTTAGK